MQRQRIRTVVATTIGLILALLGQRLLETHTYARDGALLILVGAVLFVWGAWTIRSPFSTNGVASRGFSLAPDLRVGLGVAALALAIIAWLSLGGNRFTTRGTVAWVGSCVLLLVAAWEWEPGVRERWKARLRRLLAGGWQVRISWMTVAIVGVMLLAVFFRVYHLDSIPKELGSDHAEKLLDVQDLLDGRRPIFFIRNTGREAMQFYLTYAIIKLFAVPVSFLALKIGTVLIGILAVPATFLLLRELFDRRLALLGMLMVAVSQWHVGVSRMGLRYPFPSLWATLAIYFLIRAVKHRRRNDWLLAGLMAGIGLHTYIPCRVVPLIIGAVWALDFLLSRKTRSVGWKAYLLNGAFCFAVILAVFLPLVRYMADDPQEFWGRVLGRVTGAEQPIQGNPVRILADNWVNALAAYNYKGDVVPVTVIPSVPFLDWISGGLFAVGLVWLIARGLRDRDRMALYTLVAFLAMLLPSVLSIAFPGENPSAVRMSGTIPFVYGIAALPVADLTRRLGQIRARGVGPALTAMITVPLVIGLVAVNYQRYFVTYDRQYRAWSASAGEIGEAVRGFVQCCGPLSNVYHVAWAYWVDTRNIGIVAGDIHWNNALHNADMIRATASVEGAKMYILHPDDQKDVALLQEMYPCGELLVHSSPIQGHEFLLFQAPARCAP